MTDRSAWLTTRSISLTLSVLGLVGMLVSGSLLFDVWYARRVWLGSEERQRIERQVEQSLSERVQPGGDDVRSLPQAGERKEDDGQTRDDGPRDDGPRAAGFPPDTERVPRLDVQTPRPPRTDSSPSRPVRGLPVPVVVGPTPTLSQQRATSSISTLEVVEAQVRLLALPRPGAPAVLGVTLRNHSHEPSHSIVVGVSADWFEHYSIIGAVPPVIDDRAHDDGFRYFEFPAAAPGAQVTLELHVTTEGEAARTPTLRVPQRGRAALGEVRPKLLAQEFSLGAVRALSVPRLGIRTGVVDTAWEPPAFVAGQINTTAALGEGNSVLIGHRGGQAGDVFVRLIGARLGDEVVGASHGVEQAYIVSEIRTLPNHDSTPIRPTETPRLTLMTCVGAWNPLTADYSHRLWVIAEPPELARSTLAATVARANETAAASADRSEALRARTEAALARAALAVMDARTRRQP